MLNNNRLKLVRLTLRMGLAFVFCFAALESLFRPDSLSQYVPDFVRNMIPLNIFLIMFSTTELGLVVWLLSGWKVKYASFVAFFLMLLIVALNPDQFQVLFRNVAIGLAAIALALLDDQFVAIN